MNPTGDYILGAAREKQDRNGKIRTFSGLYVDPLNLRWEDIRLVDIAHHLSLVCRYTGACPFHYSVAQHSVLVLQAAMRVYGHDLSSQHRQLYRACLMHDASEAYLNDMASPVKHTPAMQGYREAEARATQCVFEVYDLPLVLLPQTKPFDDELFQREVATFWGTTTERVPEITPRRAKENFLWWANELGFV